MKRLTFAALALLALLVPARAQLTQSQVTQDIANQLLSCGTGCNTAATLRGLLDIMAQATFQAQGASGLVMSGSPAPGWVPIATSGTAATWGPLSCSNLSNATPACSTAIGTSGAVIPLLSQPATVSGLWAFSTAPTVPTQTLGDNSTNAASTAFVQNSISGISGVATTVAFTNTTNFAAATIGTNIITVNVLAMAATGTSTCGLNYTKGTSTPTGQYQEVLNTPSGIYWEPQFDTQPVRACQFGTVADGAFNFGTNAPSGTDNTAAVQNALDFAMRNNWKTVCVNDGKYYTTDTIAIGWGIQSNTATPFSLSFVSCNQARASYDSFAGVTFFPSKYDRCAFNVGGGRQTLVKGIHVVGGNYSWANARFSNANLPVAVTAAGWLDPAITPTGTNPGGLTQFAPYAAFCVDAYNGSQPSPTAYPAQTFPAWLSNTTQYLQAGSTDTKFEDTVVEGFAVGWAFGTGPGQQNGDFNGILNSTCLATVYCVSFGSTQSRNGTMQNTNFSNIYTFLTNTRFGAAGSGGSGELGGNLLNVSGGQAYQLLDISVAIAGTTVQDYYTEAGIRIGSITGGSITFRNCLFDSGDTLSGVAPASLIEAGSGGLSIRFDDCVIAGSSRITTLVHYGSADGTVTFNGGKLNGGIKVGALMGTTGSQNAVNYTGGYFAGASVFPNSNSAFTSPLTWQGVSFASNMTTPTATTILTHTGWTQYPVVQGGNRQVVTQAMQGFYDGSNDQRYWQFVRGATSVSLDMTGGLWTTPLTLATCDTWTGQWSVSQQVSQNGQLSLGDIFYHGTTGTIFVVESIGVPNPTNYPVTLRQHNNMSVNASQSGGTAACTVNNLGTIGASPPSGNATLIHIGEAQAVTGASIGASGTGYTNGAQVLTLANGAAGTAGVCSVLPAFNVTVSGNVVTSVNSVATPGNCFMSLGGAVATTGGGGTGATLNVTYTAGVMAVSGTTYYCDFAAGSTNLANCSRGDGVATSMATTLLPGDKFWTPTFNDSALLWPFAANARIASVTNGSPGSITLGNAANRSGRFPVILFLTATGGVFTNALTALPTASGTCPIDTQAGNNIRGTFQLNGSCAGGTIILTLATTAATGWFCSANDRTNVANTFVQTASSTTTATLTGTGADNDVIGFECAPY